MKDAWIWFIYRAALALILFPIFAMGGGSQDWPVIYAFGFIFAIALPPSLRLISWSIRGLTQKEAMNRGP